jgi:hypothetical protein
MAAPWELKITRGIPCTSYHFYKMRLARIGAGTESRVATFATCTRALRAFVSPELGGTLQADLSNDCERQRHYRCGENRSLVFIRYW